MMFEYNYTFVNVSYSISTETLPNKNIYIEIANETFFQLSNKTFDSFEFKLNKRGGESGKIKFSKMFGSYKIGDNVVLYVEGKKVFIGVIEKLTNEGLTLDIIPLWGKLDYVFITDTFALEGTDTIYNIITNKVIQQKIASVGISYSIKNIDIPKDITITTTLAGRSLRDILDELESSLPSNYAYGVDEKGTFYFKGFRESREKMLNWHSGDFSSSELEKDYSNLFSQFVVKVKDNNMNAYNVLKEIVGDDNSYPATVLTDMVGKKTGVFEMGFPADDIEVLKYAYEQLKLQQPIEILKIKTLNYKKVDVNVNECLEVILKPFQNFYEDFNINFSTTPVLASGAINGTIQKVGYVVGYARESSDSGGVLDFNKQKEYVNACDRSLKINKIIVYYLSTRSVDQFKIYDTRHSMLANGNGGILNIDVDDFDKRDIKVELLNLRNSIIFLKMRCYFTQGSVKVSMNVREINYKYSKGSLNIDLKLAPLRSVLTGYIFGRDQKMKELEKLLTNPN